MAKQEKDKIVILKTIGLLSVFLIPVVFMFVPYIMGFFAFDKIYSEGDRSGQVIKISRKGMFWKTWEVGVGLTQSGAYIGNMDLSVDELDPNKETILDDLHTAYEKGSLIQIKYIQRYGTLPWRGKTEYFIKDVEIVPDRYEEFLKEQEARQQEYQKELQENLNR